MTQGLCQYLGLKLKIRQLVGLLFALETLNIYIYIYV